MDGLRKKRVEGDDILKVVILANISFRHVLILTNLHLDIHTHNNQQSFQFKNKIWKRIFFATDFNVCKLYDTVLRLVSYGMSRFRFTAVEKPPQIILSRPSSCLIFLISNTNNIVHLKRTVRRISSDLRCKGDNAQFITVPLKAYDLMLIRYP